MRILVLDVPGLHLGYLGCYGNDWVGTPNIDRLASEGVVFDRHFFDVDQPAPPAWTGHHDFPGAEQAGQLSNPGLAQLLGEREMVFIEGKSGVSIDNVEDIVAKALERGISGRSLIWARFPALLPPWNLPEDLLNSYCEEEELPWPDPPPGLVEDIDDLPRLQNTYAAVLTFIDAQLGNLFEALEARKQFGDLLIVLTAPYALPLGEHGIIGQARPWLYEEFVHLPLIMRLPGREAAGLRVGALTQPVDLFPTLLEHLGYSPPVSDGHSLWPLIRGEAKEVRAHAISGKSAGAAGEWALRTLDWALLLPATSAQDPSVRAQLYVKPEDRWEVNDVRQHHMELVEKLEKTLRRLARPGSEQS